MGSAVARGLFTILSVTALTLFACQEGTDNSEFEPPSASIGDADVDHYARVVVPAGFTQTGDAKADFLPYPGNWCEIVAGERAVGRSIVLSEAIAAGATFAISPLAVLHLDSLGTPIDILVAVPTDTSLNPVPVSSFADLITEYEPIRNILQTWFVNYRGFGSFELKGWSDDKDAVEWLGTLAESAKSQSTE